MLSISLGPIALPVAPIVLLGAVWAASWTATSLGARPSGDADRRRGADAASQAVVVAAAIGLLAARLVHLALHAAPYLESPLSMLDLRDGGWHAPGGWAAAAAWLAWRGWRVPASRRPLALAATTGLLVWTAGTLATGGARDAGSMPATVLARLDDARPIDLRTAAAGRPAVVNLWASWCGPCRQEMPTLAAAQRLEADVRFIFVNQGESAPAVRSYLAGLGVPPSEVLLDPRSELGAAVGSRGLPTTLFYDAQGRQVDAHVGVLNAAALASRLRALRASR